MKIEPKVIENPRHIKPLIKSKDSNELNAFLIVDKINEIIKEVNKGIA